jgi:hypothetical protein
VTGQILCFKRVVIYQAQMADTTSGQFVSDLRANGADTNDDDTSTLQESQVDTASNASKILRRRHHTSLSGRSLQ